MAIDQAKVGEVAAGIMEVLDEYEYGGEAEITDVLLIVAVNHSGNSTRVHWRVNPGQATHVVLGLLEYVRAAMLRPLQGG